MKNKTHPTKQNGNQPRMIAVSSGKGGVGKSTVSANIAVAMARSGVRVGLVDADIYGPSIPGMLGLDTNTPPQMNDENKVIPSEAFGVKIISMAMLTADDQPSILRGPMVAKYLRMFVAQVEWGELDILLLDLPPGTGDIQLTLAQAFPILGAVIVSTPQDVSLKIARRGLRMMEQVNVPIAGVIENMSGFTCPSCGEVSHIFHQGGGEEIAADIKVPFLGKIPLDPAIVDSGDNGSPLVVTNPDSPAAQTFYSIAKELAGPNLAQNGVVLPFNWAIETGLGKPAPVTASGGIHNQPCSLDFDSAGLHIGWADGESAVLPARDLRLACVCAACRDEVTGARLLDYESVPLSIAPVRIWSIGNYALGIAFSDGHNSGIFTFEALRQMQGANIEDV
ncbi:flagellum site-determining protein YlxH (plasmid) [Maritalea myrionectae]|uniref:Iron-sulfur cluster carrier protein n=1 Tax=Maritalea myrionectae TaxID=454601 RepID=A0A2R4MJ97_9HYPH|nr:P-loop NTPase [Maritalea myrionectae]AVX06040.1 flagellum site-determining protein YlxH [Maritalea myrionectae]